MTKLPAFNEKVFTLIEIAIIMVIIGLLAGGGVSLMGMEVLSLRIKKCPDKKRVENTPD